MPQLPGIVNPNKLMAELAEFSIRTTRFTFQRVKRVLTGSASYFRCDNQLAIACPISSGESSWILWSPGTIASLCAVPLQRRMKRGVSL